MAPWHAVEGGLLLVVRVTPRGGRDTIDGIETMADGREVLKVRVRAAPEGGKANQAIVELLAATFGLRRSDIDVTTGATARVKQVMLCGVPQHLIASLTQRCDDIFKGKS